MKKDKIFFWAIIPIGLVVLKAIFDLSYDHWMNGEVCPSLIGIPACYIILFCVVLLFISHFRLVNDKNIGFYFGTGLPWLIAFYATVKQALQIIQCPKSSSGIPMCYLSFGFFSALLILKYLEVSLGKKYL